jgi:hypothetical protein
LQFLQISLAFLASQPVMRSVCAENRAADKLEARSEGQQRNVARLLDCQAEATLVTGAHAGQTARNNLAAFGYKSLQQANVAI